jgi:hypothetical protein
MHHQLPGMEEEIEAMFMRDLRLAAEMAKELPPPFAMKPEPVTAPKAGVLISPFHLKWIIRQIERLRGEVERLEEQLRLALPIRRCASARFANQRLAEVAQ